MEERCDVGKIINRISHQLKRRMNCHEEEDSLTNMQRHVLHYILLQSMSRDIYQKDVEAEFQIRRSTATGILQLLEKNGFILRKAEDRDARLKKIVPTEKAEKVREHVLMNIDRTEKIIRQGIPDEKMAVCIETLELISANLFEDEKCCTEKPAQCDQSRSKETVPGGKQFGGKKAACKQKSIVERGANRKDG